MGVLQNGSSNTRGITINPAFDVYVNGPVGRKTNTQNRLFRL
jgi:hypothetical protein